MQAEEGYTNVYGADYSPQAIELANAIAVSREVESNCKFSVSWIIQNFKIFMNETSTKESYGINSD